MGPRVNAAQNDGRASAARIDGKTDRQSARNKNERRIAPERTAVMGAGLAKVGSHDVIASAQQLADLIRQIEAADRIALDTEADSLHSYREKLCLIQISVPAVTGIVEAGRKQHGLGMERDRRSRLQRDFIVDPLRDLDLEPLRRALEAREIVLHGADYDLRMLRR